MSKIVYRPGDVVEIKIGDYTYEMTIARRKVDEPDPETGESTVHYISTNGYQFTDDQIV